MKYIVCIYASDRPEYRRYSDMIHRAAWFRELQNDPEFRVFFVRASNDATEARMDGENVVVPVDDEYTSLAAKTYHMFRFFVERFDFDYLVKMDDSFIRLQKDVLLEKVSFKRLCVGPYGGFHLHLSLERGFRAWKKQHSVQADPNVRFPVGIPYALGKLYYCSKEASAVVASRGGEMLDRFMSLGGVEDVFVGAVLWEHFFSRAQRCTYFLRGCMGVGQHYVSAIFLRTSRLLNGH